MSIPPAPAANQPAVALRPPREQTDAELWSAVQARADDEAFAAIVSRHGTMVYRTCLRLLGNAHEAENAAQAAFIVFPASQDRHAQGPFRPQALSTRTRRNTDAGPT